MSQYPVEDQQGLFDAVNYLLSGPAGLGQNFNGFSAYQPAYLTGTFRQPYTVSTATSAPIPWYVAPVSISNIVRQNVVDGETANLEWTFSSTQPSPPFRPGQRITVSGVNPSYYNSPYVVLTCSTTGMQTQDNTTYPYPAYVSGGSAEFNNSDTQTSTDANARVTVSGPTQIVFISSQLQLNLTYDCTTASTFDVSVQINRYRGSVDTRPGAVDYLFDFDATVSEQIKSYSVSSSGSIDAGQNIFTTVLDQPNFGYYWYICEVKFTPTSGDATPGVFTVGLRSMTAQVIKQ